MARRTLYALAALLALAVGVRAGWSAWADATPLGFSDPAYYHATATNLAHGEGYSVATGPRQFVTGGESTAFFPPGYSLALAPMFRVLGTSYAVGRVFNIIVGAFVIVPVFVIAYRQFGERVGLSAAGLAAVLPSLVVWTPVLFADTFFTLLFAIDVALMMYVVRRDGSVNVTVLIMLGLLTGAAVLVRGQALVLLPIAATWWLLSGISLRTVLRTSSIALAVASILIVPWIVRNVVALQTKPVLASNVGYNLRIGHAPYSSGAFVVPVDLYNDTQDMSWQQRELAFNELGTRRAVRYALTHPDRELELSGRKIMWLWRSDVEALAWVAPGDYLGDGRGPARWSIDASYLALLFAAALGSFAGIRSELRGVAFAVLLMGAWTLFHIVFFGQPRFHLPVLVVLIPLAACAPEGCARLLKYARPKSAPV